MLVVPTRGDNRDDRARSQPGFAGRRWLWTWLGTAALLLIPLGLPPYYVIVMQSALSLSIACLGLNLLLGYTGLLSLGHAAYFGVGAYAGAFLFTFADVTSFEIYLVAGVLASTVLAGAVGALCVRTTRIFFTILTLAFTQTVHALFVSGAAFRPFGEYGKGFFLIGDGGLYLPRFTLGGHELPPGEFEATFYYVVLVAFWLSALVLSRVVRSPFGMALRAIRDNETRAAFVGIPVRRYRWQAFIVSGLFAGLAGALSGQVDRQVTPHQLDWLLSAEFVVAIILGGSRTFWGPVLGAFVTVALKEVALRFALYHGLILGLMLILIVRLLPDGLTAGAVLIWKRVRGAGRSPAS
jgi:branched-chain amino acid transport system permease protein